MINSQDLCLQILKAGAPPDSSQFSTEALSRSEFVRQLDGETVLRIKRAPRLVLGMITIGRATNNDFVLPDESASNFHAYFQLAGPGLVLVDAGSSNGTWVNGDRLETGEPRVVNILDKVKFGNLEAQLLRIPT